MRKAVKSRMRHGIAYSTFSYWGDGKVRNIAMSCSAVVAKMSEYPYSTRCVVGKAWLWIPAEK